MTISGPPKRSFGDSPRYGFANRVCLDADTQADELDNGTGQLLFNCGGRCPAFATFCGMHRPGMQNAREISPRAKSYFSDTLRILTFLDVHIRALCLAEIQLAGTTDLELRVVELFFPLRNPADGPRQRKNRCEHRRGETHRLKDDP